MSRSCDIYEEIPSKCHPRSLGLNLRLVSNSVGFSNQALFIPLCEKCHPRLQTSGYQKPRSFNEVVQKSRCNATWADFGSWPIRPFNLLCFTAYMCIVVRLSRQFSTDSYI
jgi:hypothetical protein